MKSFSQLREETSYEMHKKRVQKIPKGSAVSFTHSTTGKKVTGEYRGLKQMGGRSYAHVEHDKGATYVPVHQIHESEQLDENVEDQQSEMHSDFTHLISHVKDKAKRKNFVSDMHRGNEKFASGYENDDDDELDDGLDRMHDTIKNMKDHTGVHDVAKTHLGKLTHHTDSQHRNVGDHFHDKISDAWQDKDHKALDKHIDDLHAYTKKHNLHESEQLDEISVQKMKDYQDKASADAGQAIDDAEQAGSSRKADPYYRRADKRERGIDRADRLIAKRMTNEAAEGPQNFFNKHEHEIRDEHGEDGIRAADAYVKAGKLRKTYDGVGSRRTAWYDAPKISRVTNEAEEVPDHKWSNIPSHRGLHQFYTSLNKKGDGWITQHNKGETTHHKTYQGVTDHIKKFVGPKEPHIHTTNDSDPRVEEIFDRDDEGWKKHPLLKMRRSVRFDEDRVNDSEKELPGVPGVPKYLLKRSSLGHHFVDAAVGSQIGKKVLASGRYTTKKLSYTNERGEKVNVNHIVPKE